MNSRRFTVDEIQYLLSLDAVDDILNASRIRWNPEFRERFITRYEKGESPTAIFREAGVGPEVIGRKRMERCCERWRDQAGYTVASRGEALLGSLEQKCASGSSERSSGDILPASSVKRITQIIALQDKRIKALEKQVASMQGGDSYQKVSKEA